MDAMHEPDLDPRRRRPPHPASPHVSRRRTRRPVSYREISISPSPSLNSDTSSTLDLHARPDSRSSESHPNSEPHSADSHLESRPLSDSLEEDSLSKLGGTMEDERVDVMPGPSFPPEYNENKTIELTHDLITLANFRPDSASKESEEAKQDLQKKIAAELEEALLSKNPDRTQRETQSSLSRVSALMETRRGRDKVEKLKKAKAKVSSALTRYIAAMETTLDNKEKRMKDQQTSRGTAVRDDSRKSQNEAGLDLDKYLAELASLRK